VWRDRAHFLAAASIVMRRILVDHARQRIALKRRAGQQRVELGDFMAWESPRVEQLLILDEALTKLAEWDSRKARLVEMIYFGGLTEEEAGAGDLTVAERLLQEFEPALASLPESHWRSLALQTRMDRRASDAARQALDELRVAAKQ
jgi:RNA polymerase sigma factor (TIGR02999 family)